MIEGNDTNFKVNGQWYAYVGMIKNFCGAGGSVECGWILQFVVVFH